MIEPMRKMAILCAEPLREPLLNTLQEFGKCHVEGMEQVPGSKQLKEQKEALEQALHLLKTLRRNQRKHIDSKPFSGSAEDWLNNLMLRTAQIQTIQQQKKTLEAMLHAARVWGNTDPKKLAALKSSGIELTLFGCALAEKPGLSAAISAHLLPVYQEGDQEYFVSLERLPGQDASARLLRTIPPPVISKEQIQQQWDALDYEEKVFQNDLNTGMHYVRFVRNSIAEIKDQIQFQKANTRAQNERGIVRLTVWVPKEHVQALQNVLDVLPVLSVSLRPEGLYEVPILLRHNALGKLFQPITKLFSLPNYGELDPTVFFAPFFTLYFGLCGADIGYGMILSLSALVVWFVSKDATVRALAPLGVLLGAAIMLAGIASGTFFGFLLFTWPPLAGLRSWAVLSDLPSAFSFALAVGFIQLCTGYLLRMTNRWRQIGMWGIAQPAGYLLIVLGLACWLMLPLGDAFNPASIAVGKWIKSLVESNPILPMMLIGIGLVLLLFLGNPSASFARRPLLGLWDIYSLATGVPTDVLSYLRLFALGLSGALLGSAVNMVAFGLYQHSIWSGIAAGLVWLVGHAINLALVLLSAFVHPLRLTFVEFYKSMDFRGGGRPYVPFKKNTLKIYLFYGNTPLSSIDDRAS